MFRTVHALVSGVHREEYHGHNCALEITFHKCEVAEVDREVQREVLSRLDAHDLGQVIQPPTGEVLVEWIHQQLEQSALKNKIIAVAVQETRKNRFVSARSDPRLI
jgi:hypothetical protein